MHLTNEHLTFLARFAKSPEGHAMLEFLQAKLSEREAKSRTATGEDVYRNQGRLLELDELIADISEAHSKLNRQQPTLKGFRSLS